jgi:arsenate reductase (glutaredoxin)
MIAAVATTRSDLVLYHNKNCGSSRKALAWLQAHDADPRVVEYLKEPLDRDALVALVDRLEDAPASLVRHDKRFAELGLEPDRYDDPADVVAVLVEHPELMQRPVVDDGTKAIIARPPEDRLAAFFGN